jgi:VanZ family protein
VEPAVLPVLAGLAVGALDELNQAAVPGRTADPADWLADALGVGIAFLVTAARYRNSTKERQA